MQLARRHSATLHDLRFYAIIARADAAVCTEIMLARSAASPLESYSTSFTPVASQVLFARARRGTGAGGLAAST